MAQRSTSSNVCLALLALSCYLCAFSVASADPPPRFPNDAVWHQNISQAPLHPQSPSMISTLQGLGGFGFGRMQIDFGLHIVRADSNAPTRTIVAYPSADSYYSPDCEAPGTAMPVPTNAAIEAVNNLTCNNAGEDCHLLVVQGDVLYEAYRANAPNATQLQAQCLAIWKLDRVYPESNRGDHCTSADAAGFPIAPLLFNADEVFAATQISNGDLGHAIRFILPNARMASNSGTPLYVRPASHAGGPSGPSGSIPYGSRLRLRSDFPMTNYSAAAQVILRTMQRYGIVLADGGNIALTAESDLYTTKKWNELGIGSRVFDSTSGARAVAIQDFQVIDTGARIIETYDCVRNPEPQPPNKPENLSATAQRLKGAALLTVSLQWVKGSARVDIYRNGVFQKNIANTGNYYQKSSANPLPIYQVCNADTTLCSNSTTVDILKIIPNPPLKPSSLQVIKHPMRSEKGAD
jgi:hypothetical protein